MWWGLFTRRRSGVKALPVEKIVLEMNWDRKARGGKEHGRVAGLWVEQALGVLAKSAQLLLSYWCLLQAFKLCLTAFSPQVCALQAAAFKLWQMEFKGQMPQFPWMGWHSDVFYTVTRVSEGIVHIWAHNSNHLLTIMIDCLLLTLCHTFLLVSAFWAHLPNK